MFAKHPRSRRAEIGLPLQAIVEIVLISFAAVAMLSFVSQLGDNTAFQQKMLVREAALTATVASSAPSSAYARILHVGKPALRKELREGALPMDLFTFSLEDNKAGVRVRDDTLLYPFGALGQHPKQMARSAFVVAYDGRLSLSNEVLPSPLLQICPKIAASNRRVYVDAGATPTADQQAVRSVIDSLFREIPPGLLSVIEQRSAQGLFTTVSERSALIVDKAKTTISLQFDSAVNKPVIYYNVDASRLQETKKLACALSNALSTIASPVPMIPLNPVILADSDSRVLIDDTEVLVQLVLPPSIGLMPEALGSTAQDNQQMLKQGIFKAVEVYIS